MAVDDDQNITIFSFSQTELKTLILTNKSELFLSTWEIKFISRGPFHLDCSQSISFFTFDSKSLNFNIRILAQVQIQRRPLRRQILHLHRQIRRQLLLLQRTAPLVLQHRPGS